MGKRQAEELENHSSQLKSGERPLKLQIDDEVIEYEDEFEDEFDSEDEIFEAGIDGRPDEEQPVEDSQGMWITPITLCESAILITYRIID